MHRIVKAQQHAGRSHCDLRAQIRTRSYRRFHPLQYLSPLAGIMTRLREDKTHRQAGLLRQIAHPGDVLMETAVHATDGEITRDLEHPMTGARAGATDPHQLVVTGEGAWHWPTILGTVQHGA